MVFTKFHLDRERQFLYEFSVESWCFRVIADISARSSRGKKEVFFIYVFFVHVQQCPCCGRVSASNFQVLVTRNSGGGRAVGNTVRFLAGLARTIS